jgi:hypothetical protein
MKPTLRCLCAIVCVLWTGMLHPLAAEIPTGEKQKIEALIAQVENLKDATFIRNGSDYDSKLAARFLRGKWSSNEDEIKSAQDFITKAATGSSTSGKPYLIRFKDGREVTCADYLKAELGKLEPPKEKP